MASSILVIVIVFIASVTSGLHDNFGDQIVPEFYSPLENITTTQGRDVQFTCVVNHLGEYRVAWIKSDSKAILAIHNRLVAHNPRLAVTHNGHNTWKLHISNIQKNDSGSYMCQINTDPMRWQIGYLNVTVPPDILNDDDAFSDGYQALEGGTIHLRCRATGEPQPEVSWKREDGKSIILRKDKRIESNDIVYGENLTLYDVNRWDMGNYLCLARSSVPPIMSKRFSVRVNFKPQVLVENHYVGAPQIKDVRLHCRIEASPKPTYQWINNRNEPVMPNQKIHITEHTINEFTTEMDLIIKNVEKRDYGEYICVSENTIGRAEGKIRLSELMLEVVSTKLPSRVDYVTKSSKEVAKVNKYNNNHLRPVTKLPPYYKTTRTYPNIEPEQTRKLENNDVEQDVRTTSLTFLYKNQYHNNFQSVVNRTKEVLKAENKSRNEGNIPRISVICELFVVLRILW